MNRVRLFVVFLAVLWVATFAIDLWIDGKIIGWSTGAALFFAPCIILMALPARWALLWMLVQVAMWFCLVAWTEGQEAIGRVFVLQNWFFPNVAFAILRLIMILGGVLIRLYEPAPNPASEMSPD